MLERGATLSLADGLEVRRALIMGARRVELTGFAGAAVERLKAEGCMTEIIAWTLRMFVPVGPSGPDVLARLLARHPLVQVIDRAAA